MSKTRPPARVQVGPYRLDVAVSNRRLAEHSVHRGDRPDALDGGCDLSGGRILIRERLGRDAFADTLLHEVLHACLAITGCSLDVDAEEQVVLPLAPLLFDTLRRNPDLAAYLLNA